MIPLPHAHLEFSHYLIITKKDYPERLKRIAYYDEKQDKKLVFLTNNFTLPAMTITEIYRKRWQIELFFKWIKQHP